MALSGAPTTRHSRGRTGYLATVCGFSTFQKMVASKTQSWAQRRRMMGELRTSIKSFDDIEQKMIRAEALTSEEQEMYEVASREDIEEKVKWLVGQLKSMVDEGNLTIGEKQQLLDLVGQKVDMAQKELDTATAEGKPKKVDTRSSGRRRASLSLPRIPLKTSPCAADGVVPSPPRIPPSRLPFALVALF